MGFNTPLVILNDHLHDIEHDPHFGRRVSEAIRDTYGRARNHHNSFAVLPSQHADYYNVVVVGGNTVRRIEDMPREEALKILKTLAFRLDHRVSKLPREKA